MVLDIEELSLLDNASHVNPSTAVDDDDHDKGSDQMRQDRVAVYLKTWGCSHNNSDGEYMAGLLDEAGYRVILGDNEKLEAQVWVLNGCTVKSPSESTFHNAINQAKANDIKLILTGCVPQASLQAYSKYSIVGVQQIDRIVEAVEEVLQGKLFKAIQNKFATSDSSDGQLNQSGGNSNKRHRKAGGAKLQLPKIRKNPYVEIIPINTGCLNQCTYCKTKHARGDLGSYSIAEIVDRMQQVLHEGVVEIWLTSEDLGAYGLDIGHTLPDLLRKVVRVVTEYNDSHGFRVMIRLGMTNPPYILDDVEAIAEILNHKYVYKFLHIPVQAGSNLVLGDMKREYTIEEFKYLTTYLQKNVPGISIATDIICGFPTETDEDFQMSLDVIDWLKPSVLHISQFYARPNTVAAAMDRLPNQTIKDRSRQMTQLFYSYQTYAEAVGTVQEVLVTEVQKKNKGGASKEATEDISSDGKLKNCWVAHDQFYRQVLIARSSFQEQDTQYLGMSCKVKIKSCGKFYLIGELTEEPRQANVQVQLSSVMLHRAGQNNRTVEVMRLKVKQHNTKWSVKEQILLSVLISLLAVYIALRFQLLKID
ncbi:hypothetical protein MIR68_000609 [Amoeboaphelidium protococcarum]|nr:hypothetical protein MIR68_000609 [Amoeboaphelidium protococcarum]